MHRSAGNHCALMLLFVSTLSKSFHSLFLEISIPDDSRDITTFIKERAKSKSPLRKIAFGSCNDQSFPQPLWKNIINHSPEIWIWMGDNIYADTRELSEQRFWSTSKLFQPANKSTLTRRYNMLLADEGYRALLRQCPVIGTWDDHDYGINDGDRYYRNRDDSQSVFLDFMREPIESARRIQKGVYTAYTIGSSEQSVKIILLDVRYHRDPYDTPNGDFLGEEQWKFLEAELLNSNAKFNLIVSGIQILPTDRFFPAECWNRFPKQRLRLINLILQSQASGVILLSGDVHFSELNQIQCEGGTITEITSSGMTHSWMEFHLTSLKLIAAFIFTVGNLFLPWDYRFTRESFYAHLNWGEIQFNWEQTPHPVAIINIRGLDDHIKIQHHIPSKPLKMQTHWNASDCKPPRQTEHFETILRRMSLFLILSAFFLQIPIGVLVASVFLWRVIIRKRSHTRKNKLE